MKNNTNTNTSYITLLLKKFIFITQKINQNLQEKKKNHIEVRFVKTSWNQRCVVEVGFWMKNHTNTLHTHYY